MNTKQKERYTHEALLLAEDKMCDEQNTVRGWQH